jgi:hypothetical protein
MTVQMDTSAIHFRLPTSNLHPFSSAVKFYSSTKIIILVETKKMMTKPHVLLCVTALTLHYGATSFDVIDAVMNMEESQEYLKTVCGLLQF